MSSKRTHKQNVGVSFVFMVGFVVLAVLAGWTAVPAAIAGWGIAWFVRDVVDMLNHERNGKK